MVRVHALLLCARFVGQQLHPGMADLAVNLAYVIDNSLARDAEVDFAKIEFAGTGFLSEGHAPRSRAARDDPAAGHHRRTLRPDLAGPRSRRPSCAWTLRATGSRSSGVRPSTG